MDWEKQMKICGRCYKPKDEKEFQEREDAWGTYSWCYPCRVKEGRYRVSKKQEEFMRKTQLFVVGGQGDGAENSISHLHPLQHKETW